LLVTRLPACVGTNQKTFPCKATLAALLFEATLVTNDVPISWFVLVSAH